MKIAGSCTSLALVHSTTLAVTCRIPSEAWSDPIDPLAKTFKHFATGPPVGYCEFVPFAVGLSLQLDTCKVEDAGFKRRGDPVLKHLAVSIPTSILKGAKEGQDPGSDTLSFSTWTLPQTRLHHRFTPPNLGLRVRTHIFPLLRLVQQRPLTSKF